MARRYVIEALLFGVYFVFGASWLAWSPLLPEVERNFGIGHTQAGLLISIVSVAKAFMPIFGGLLAARIGLRRAILVGASAAALAVVAPLAPSFGALLGIRLLFGMGGAIVVTLMGAMVMAWFPRHELPVVNALNNVAVNTGVTLALFVTVPLAVHFGWRVPLFIIGGLAAVLAVAWAFFGADAERVVAAPAVPPLSLLRQAAARRETWLIALAFSGPLSLYLALNTWLPMHFQQAFGLARTAASQATGLFNLVGIPAALLGGVLTTRLGLRRPAIVVSGLMLPFAAIGLCASPNATMRLVSAAVLGACFFLYVAPLFTIPTELPDCTPASVGMISGVVYSVAYLLSFVSPMLVGWAHDVTGSFLPGLVVFAVLSVSLAVGGWLLPETGPAARRAELPTGALHAA